LPLNLIIVSENKLSFVLGHDTVVLPTLCTGVGFSMSGAEGMHITMDFDQYSYECPVADAVDCYVQIS
jgi:hypothetical protein